MNSMNGVTGVFSNSSAGRMVPREGLVKKMKSLCANKNIFLSAPGGYGKTVAASQWLSSLRGKTAKMNIGDADNEPDLFYRRLELGLLNISGMKKNLPNPGSSLDELLETIHRLPETSARCYFALDDLHKLKNPELISRLPLIAARLPDYFRLCLISRSEPPPALRETGLFEALAKDSLLFSPEEVEWLGAEKGRRLTEGQINRLLETTGGWAMYLSALLSGDELPYRAAKGGAPQTLTKYLDARVWKPWDSETKALLLSLAIPAELTPELAARLTGQPDGRDVLERLAEKENAFLSLTGADTYRFHDIFHAFLLERLDDFFGKDEIRRLNDLAARWYYEQGDYYTGAKHYINNGDHEGIDRCMRAVNRFHEDIGDISIESQLNFTKRYVVNLSPEFIYENPYLISKCVAMSFNDGDAGTFKRYIDMLFKKLREISARQPNVMGTYGFSSSMDFRVPLKKCAKRIAVMLPLITAGGARMEAKVSTVTGNLPFFHRAIRDYSEFHELREDEMKTIRDTFGVLIGKDYDILEEATYAGIYYERGELIEAMSHALIAYYACSDATHPEAMFCAHSHLAYVLSALGAAPEASGIMERMEGYMERKAHFLRPNFKALQTELALRGGNADAAAEWLAVYATPSSRLPFYQICRHFTTLRSYMAVRDYTAAAAFGTRLQALAADYERPLDMIESGLLTALALWRKGEKSGAVRQLRQTVKIAMPYGFTQLFINEGKELLDLLWELRKNPGGTDGLADFAGRLAEVICKKHRINPAEGKMPRLSKQQRAMLPYLKKGMTYNQIADAAGLGRGTVKTHVLLLYKRLGVRSAREAVVKAKLLGLLA